MKNTDWSKDELEYLIENYKLKTDRELSIELGRSTSAVSIKLSRLGKKRGLKQDFDRRYFSNIDSPDKAYWLGFIYADGWVDEHGLGVSLKSSDEHHLRKLNKSLRGNITIEKRTRILKGTSCEMSTVRFYSKEMLLDLFEQGVHRRKSLTISFPSLQPVFMWHFIRGFFDGDGSIGVEKRSNQIRCKFTCASPNFLDDLGAFLKRQGINFYITSGGNSKSSDLYVANKGSVKLFLDKLYENANLFLGRKYNIYINNRHLLEYKRSGWLPR